MFPHHHSEATQKPLLTPIEMDSDELEWLEDGQWISGDIVNFALQYVYQYLNFQTHDFLWYIGTPSAI